MPRHYHNKNKELIRNIIESSIKYKIPINASWTDFKFVMYTFNGSENIVLKINEIRDYYIKKIRKEGLPIMWQIQHKNELGHFPIQNGDMLKIKINDYDFESWHMELVKFVQEVCIRKIQLDFFSCTYNNRIPKEDIQIFCNNITLVGKTQIEFYGPGDFRDIEIDNELLNY